MTDLIPLETEDVEDRTLRNVLRILEDSMLESPILVQSINFDGNTIEFTWIDRNLQSDTVRSLNLDELVILNEDHAEVYAQFQDLARVMIRDIAILKAEARDANT